MPVSQPGKFKTSAVDNSFGGDGAGGNNTGEFNVFVGTGSGINNTGDRNIFVGANGPQDNTGSDNTYIGYNVAPTNAASVNATVVGSNSFSNDQATLAVDNVTIVGAFNLPGMGSPVTSGNIVSIGDNIGQAVTGSQVINRSIFIGQGMAATAGVNYDDAVFIGMGADGGSQDVVIGTDAFNTSAGGVNNFNVVIGHEAAQFCQLLNENVFVGYRAGFQSFGTLSTNNVAIGSRAGQNMFGANNNVYVGRNAGMGNGDDNIMIGPNLGGNGNRNIFIGEGVVNNGSDLFAVQSVAFPAAPLISGEFANRNFGINANLTSLAYGGGVGVIGLTNATTLPTADSLAGGILYVNAGALEWRGSGGTVTVIAPA